jgi:hypothetical protein
MKRSVARSLSCMFIDWFVCKAVKMLHFELLMLFRDHKDFLLSDSNTFSFVFGLLTILHDKTVTNDKLIGYLRLGMESTLPIVQQRSAEFVSHSRGDTSLEFDKWQQAAVTRDRIQLLKLFFVRPEGDDDALAAVISSLIALKVVGTEDFAGRLVDILERKCSQSLRSAALDFLRLEPALSSKLLERLSPLRASHATDFQFIDKLIVRLVVPVLPCAHKVPWKTWCGCDEGTKTEWKEVAATTRQPGEPTPALLRRLAAKGMWMHGFTAIVHILVCAVWQLALST